MKIAKNTLYQVIMKIFTASTTLLITVLIARHFGLSGYGDFIKITAYVGLFYLFTDFGLNAIFLQKKENQISFRDLLYLRIAFAVILFFAAIGISFFLPYEKTINLGFSSSDRLGIAIFSLTIFTQTIIFSSAAIFQKHLRYDFAAKAGIIGSLVTLAFVAISIFLSLPLFYILGGFVLGGLTTSVVSLFFTKENITPLVFNYPVTKKLLRESLPLGIMLLFSFVYFRTDIFLLSIMKSSSEVGVYGLSGKLFEFLIALPLFLSNAIYPTLLKKESFAKISKLAKRYLLLFIGLSICILVPFWFLSPLVVLIKPEFILSVTPFRILLLSLPFFFATSILQWILIAEKKQTYLMFVYIGVTFLNIALNLIFIPKYSYIASAVITSVLEAIVFIPLFVKVFWFTKTEEIKN